MYVCGATLRAAPAVLTAAVACVGAGCECVRACVRACVRVPSYGATPMPPPPPSRSPLRCQRRPREGTAPSNAINSQRASANHSPSACLHAGAHAAAVCAACYIIEAKMANVCSIMSC
jgi:hypothetical protein